ncbi:signal transduction histidine kinase [Thiohalobacter thiocyanaticus]|uniref:histidine kinase n=1 Tax=Thiohalobacter thiocyanaticus TaxID=585455 RepID=A0A1Z4VMH7_9GAMM|nr:HAMP domain-containing sensor histidine kinase [Thiohalobacter thiocyanaticus]BAZ92807.1 signal transduction histidine kinase [Thiohalobacter thiocyanaticus]
MSTEPEPYDFSLILANSVHDMKNSVGMLIGALDELGGGEAAIDDPALRDMSKLRYEAKRLNANLIQLLALYKINELGYALNIVENDVEEVIEECFLEQEAFMELQGVVFEMDCDPELVWFFDRELVSSVLNSVINNAYRYTRDRIRIGAGTVDGRLALFVEDNGPGYPDAMQVNSAPDLGQAIDFKSGSTGLGLYFTATIARMHQHKDREGYIELANTGIDGGGRFTLYLP